MEVLGDGLAAHSEGAGNLGDGGLGMAFEVVRDAAAACRRAALGNLGEVFGARAAVALRLAIEGPAEPAFERCGAHGLRLLGVAGGDGVLRLVFGKAELGGKAHGILEDALDGPMALVA